MKPTVPAAQEEEPSVAGVRVRPALAMVLYVLLAVSFAAAIWSQAPERDAPEAVRRLSPIVFLVFAVGFAAYRAALVVARKYSAGKAFFQIGAAALFCVALFMPRAPGPGDGAGASDLAPLLSHAQPAVRALAAEVARTRPDAARWAPALVRALEDPDAAVRAEAHRSLVALNQGVDLGPADDAGARAAWEGRFP